MATYTFDVFSTLDGYGSSEVWPGYWGKEGPELVADREKVFSPDKILVLGATTYRTWSKLSEMIDDPSFDWLYAMQKVVLSTTLEGPLKWPNTTLIAEDALTAVPRLKAESDLPLRSHGSMTMNRALMAAGLVDRIEVVVFPVITGASGLDPIWAGAADFDLELIEARTFDGRTQQLVYVPHLHDHTT
ncbi:MAG TPA: dihydrofolate reductase family protein [Rhodococcus sp. (in: high G+C Gram-positive bacteria)]|uniref:dihydrofolate reductase family protein n=1 Tax=Rhodococcus sp. SMB37 TaxID=2512213 RepID=UPI0006D100E7|nr:dihydrofolate reductase family protein [Rhodococcus sp. SMB37]TCN55809.1 dihydrofolate reductase [Rhodococcus sp. SMB37]HET8994939.1 dihydrofolate reductase family protein [Rhodococcus sp. (in: high G+C Gram-positive bacteria)]